jgi:predicted MFS family arabinose efflux permease
MYVNAVFAAIAVSGALALLHNQASVEKPKIDVPGTITVSGGLFALVYGLNHAQTTSWGNTVTLGLLGAGAALLAVFVAIERRVSTPLLPLRVVLDRNRGAAYISMLLASAAMFGVFLFLTYYLQQTRGYSPVTTGLAFLPMTAVVMVTAVVATTQLRDRTGPRPLVFAGMALGAAGMLILTGLDVTTAYLTGILPALVVLGAGLGLVFSTAMNSATLGVQPHDAGVASATVNAAQQVGGSLGTALLSTIAVTATANFVRSAATRPNPALLAHAAVHGYTTAFAVSAGIFAVAAVLAPLLFAGKRAQPVASGEPVLVA